MSNKRPSFSWLKQLRADARLYHQIAAAEEDVRNGRERPLAEVRLIFEQKWALRRSMRA